MIRLATLLDLDDIWQLRLETSQLLKERKIDQWQFDQPDLNTFKRDIQNGYFYLYLLDEKIVGMISIQSQIEVTYNQIFDGNWSLDEPYITIHRLAVKKQVLGQKIARELIMFAENFALLNQIRYIRIDTHEHNIYAIRLFESLGYQKRGWILLNLSHGDNKRLAFDKIILEKGEENENIR